MRFFGTNHARSFFFLVPPSRLTMTEEIQAEPPRPRRRRFDDADDEPIRKPPEGIPGWTWLLIGAATIFCIVMVLGALTWFLMPMPAVPPPVDPQPIIEKQEDGRQPADPR
jgi:hypothetical protein